MINVSVKEGWAGGPRLSRQFRDAVTLGGFGLTAEIHADVIIAHSTACFDLQTKSPATLYILIDPPYWPRKHLLRRVVHKKQADNQAVKQVLGWKGVLVKSFWELVYVIAKPSYTMLGLKNDSNLSFLAPLKDKRVIVVRNERDDFCSPDVQAALNGYPNVLYVQLPGQHDDYYTNPNPYLNLVAKIYN